MDVLRSWIGQWREEREREGEGEKKDSASERERENENSLLFISSDLEANELYSIAIVSACLPACLPNSTGKDETCMMDY